MKLSIKSDLKKLSKKLNLIQRRQLPFATAKALTATAIDVQKATTRQLKKDIDKPTPFTMRAIGFRRASKRDLNSVVFIKRIQAKYLKWQIEGGTRRSKSTAPVIIPRKEQRNRYGNMARNKLRNLSQKDKLLIKDRVAFQKYKRKVKPIAYFASKARYSKRFKFYERANSTARKVFARHLDKSIKLAIRTAK